MMRTAGFIFGICLVAVAFLLVLEPGDRPRPAAFTPPEAAQAPADRSEAVAALTQQPDASRAPAENTLQREGPTEATPTHATGDDGGAADSDPETPGPLRAARDGEDRTEPDSPAEVVSAESVSYLFWSPFRSAWAAAGFAGRLSVATEVPVEVVESGPGRYRVGFRYHDEAERRARVDLIEAITGLELE